MNDSVMQCSVVQYSSTLMHFLSICFNVGRLSIRASTDPNRANLITKEQLQVWNGGGSQKTETELLGGNGTRGHVNKQWEKRTGGKVKKKISPVPLTRFACYAAILGDGVMVCGCCY